ncbi:hypothetical protein [Methylobacterium platani]|uniref:Uncharacterized protein n=2 Tax=Methylobacterium platani TaxID=427683 RepID=A0A179SIQ7_9HYPH|nr:hypothetical protein [Methylobacterium platani]KMO14357.1 hypothetical protein SQ03_19805 [Methylobacterium platani JCM 14648]OAS27359.1 hypothetical protein A5481_01770 [Methylobacterium platani]
MSPPPRIPLDERLPRLAAASQALAGEIIGLGVALQVAWFEAWTQPVLAATEAWASGLARRTRRDRLMRRGVPAHLAGRSLHLVRPRAPQPP